MYVIKVLSILLITTNALAEIEDERNLEDSKLQDLEVISPTVDTDEDNEIKRAKKSATTTFCVEIRPSGPFQKPFQVCEPSEPAKPPEPTSVQTYSSYFAAPNYVPQEQPKPLPTQPKPNAIYSAPVKTYVPPPPQPKPYAAHSAAYSNYRSKSEESGSEDHRGHLMQMSHVATQEENNSDQQLRATSQGLYGSRSYGAASSYVPIVPEHAEKHRSHNGLVITCQPNLAGYAHNVPSSLHHPPALHSYSYRASAPKEYGRYDQLQLQSYGNYQQPLPYKAVDRTYKSTSSHHQSSGSSGALPTNQYSGVYGSQTAYAPAHSMVPHLAPQPAHSYAHFSQSYNQAPAPTYGPPAPTYGPPAPLLPPPPPPPFIPPPAPVYPPAPPAYVQTQSYSNFPSPASASSSSSQSQSYVAPGTYGEAGEEPRMQQMAQQHKEKHTLKKMEEVSHQRVAGTQWGSEMSQDKTANNKKEEHVASSQGWSAKKRATEPSGDVKVGSDKMDGKNEAENEVK